MSIATLHPDVRAAFRARLQALPGLVTDRAWEGRPFTPTKGTPWLRETMRPISSQVRGVGRGGIVEHRLVGAVTLFWPAGEPLVDMEAQAGAILESFEPGVRLSHGSNVATIVQGERSPIVQEPDWQSCTVTITLRAHTTGSA